VAVRSVRRPATVRNYWVVWGREPCAWWAIETEASAG
jgi:hypothetical protein